MKWSLGVDYETINNKCSKGKPLKVHRGLVLEYIHDNNGTTPKCDECKKNDLHLQDFFYRCSEWSTCQCKYDLCRHCALINCDPPFLNTKMKFKF